MQHTPNTADLQQLESAKKELRKLPMLGPVLWLYARDPVRKHTFVADLDWRLMPPLVLEQCRIFHKDEVPWAYFSWAYVSQEIDQRLRSSQPVIAPHEWHSGDIPWIIDAVMPFGGQDQLMAEVVKLMSKGKAVNAWLPDSAGKIFLREFL